MKLNEQNKINVKNMNLHVFYIFKEDQIIAQK